MADEMIILPEARAVFDALGLTSFDDVMTFRADKLVSKHAHRDTAQIDVELPDGPARLFLKRDFRVPSKHLREDLLRVRRPTAQPIREWQALELCEQRGIPAMGRLACGQRTHYALPAQAFILVRAVPESESLDAALRRLNCAENARPTARQRIELARAVGRLAARMHDADLTWPDMVAKHVFVTWRDDVNPPRWDLRFIDLERMSTGAAEGKRRGELERLLHSIACHGLRATDMLRFARVYAGCDGQPWPAARSRLRQSFAWAAPLFARQVLDGREPLPMPDHTPEPGMQRFIRHGPVRVNEARAELVGAHGLDDIEAVFAWDRGDRLDKDNIGTWRKRWRIELVDADGGTRTCYLKRYDRPPPAEQLRRIVRRRAHRGTAWWEWSKIRQLAEAGIPAPTPVACGGQLWGWIERRSFIITEGIPGEPLERWVPAHLGPDGYVDWRRRRELVLLLARLVRRLHRHELIHRDLYLSHVFISHNADGQPVLWLIDLQRLFTPWLRRQRWVVKDLAALHYSTPADCVPTTERVRFLHAYLGVEKLRPKDKRLVRAILKRTRRTARHNRAAKTG